MASITDLIGAGGQLASAVLPYELSGDQIDYLKQLGTDLSGQATQLGQQASEAAAFTPFTVTTGTGSTQVGAGGQLTQTLGETPQAIQEGMLAQALSAVPTTQVTPQALLEQIRAARAPETERQRLAIENRLAAQGRLGTQSGMFGGTTPELQAFEQSLRQQESQDILSALTQAGALTGQNVQNIQGMLGVGYTPETQALSALTPAVNLANIAQSAGLGQSEALYKGGIAGLEAQTGAGTAAAALEGQRVRGLADALSAYFGAEATAGQTSPYQSLLDALGLGSGGQSSTSSAVNAALEYAAGNSVQDDEGYYYD